MIRLRLSVTALSFLSNHTKQLWRTRTSSTTLHNYFTKMSSTTPEYTLHYWSSIPGRGEYIRLAFEAAGVPYAEALDVGELQKRMMSTDVVSGTPHFAPPILEFTAPGANIPSSAVHSTSKEGAERASKVSRTGSESRAFLSQTSAILAFVGPKFGLVGDVEGEGADERELRRARVNQLVLTALDLGLEAHDVRTISMLSSVYFPYGRLFGLAGAPPNCVEALLYVSIVSHCLIMLTMHHDADEDQLPESKRRAHDFRTTRIPKFFQYFDLVLTSNQAGKTYLIAGSLTTADLVLFQVRIRPNVLHNFNPWSFQPIS
jgi:glutathione S-transferase